MLTIRYLHYRHGDSYCTQMAVLSAGSRSFAFIRGITPVLPSELCLRRSKTTHLTVVFPNEINIYYRHAPTVSRCLSAISKGCFLFFFTVFPLSMNRDSQRRVFRVLQSRGHFFDQHVRSTLHIELLLSSIKNWKHLQKNSEQLFGFKLYIWRSMVSRFDGMNDAAGLVCFMGF